MNRRDFLLSGAAAIGVVGAAATGAPVGVRLPELRIGEADGEDAVVWRRCWSSQPNSSPLP